MKINTKKRNHYPTNYRQYARPYPNAADTQYYIDKLVDGALAVVTGMGAITIFLFLITM